MFPFLPDFRYNGSSMITLFLLMPFVALFMVINIILGCYLAIRLGYGPPNWQKALNLIIPLTTLQDSLNDGRDWLEKKAPWTVKYLNRLHIPKPIIFVDVTAPEEGTEEEEENVPEEAVGETEDETGEEASADQADEPPDGQADAAPPAEEIPFTPAPLSHMSIPEILE
jgi:hypothetical protein